MKNYVIKSIYSKRIIRIDFKEEDNIKKWRQYFFIPFMQLDKKTNYFISYSIFEGFKGYRYTDKGNPQCLYTRLLKRIVDAQQLIITVILDDKSKEHWLFEIK